MQYLLGLKFVGSCHGTSNSQCMKVNALNVA